MSDANLGSGEKRPKIPAHLRRRVLVEAGHRCSIPICRHIEVEVHHIIPWAKCQAHKYDNLIALCPNCHRRVDRREIDRKSLRLYKTNLRFAHDKYSQLELDTLFELNQRPDGQMPWLTFMLILLKRIRDSGFISVHGTCEGTFIDNIKTTPDWIATTPRGREFIADLGIAEL